MKLLRYFPSLRDLHELAKTKLSAMNAMMPLAGSYAVSSSIALSTASALFVGNFFLAASSQCLGQIIEKYEDSIMKRTMNRPIAGSRISVKTASIIAAGWFSIGTLTLFSAVPTSSAIISLSAYFLYIGYIGLKKIHPSALYVGAIVGLLPIFAGGLAVTTLGAITTKLIKDMLFMFNWQIPHFIGILWKHNLDYQKAGFKMHSEEDTFFYVSLLFLIGQLWLIYSLPENDPWHKSIKAILWCTILAYIYKIFFLWKKKHVPNILRSQLFGHYSIAAQYYFLYNLGSIQRNFAFNKF